MPRTDREKLRLASRLQEALQAGPERALADLHDRLAYAVSLARQFMDSYRRLGLCRQFNLLLAARRLQVRIERCLQELADEIHWLRTRPPDCASAPSLGEVLKELEQIEAEFGGYTYDPARRSLAVVTEPIELEDVYLGPFEIRLDLEELSDPANSQPYRVIALDPHPACCNSGVTHPHVSDEMLCAGEAAVSIRRALQSGRLCDFFLLIRSVLEAYNPASPYVSLADWDGQPCSACGEILSEDDRHTCTVCERDFCDECIGYCAGCDGSVCHDCLQECAGCEDLFCPDCLRRCERCQEMFCSACMEGRICRACSQLLETDDEKEKEQEDRQQEPQRPGPPPASTAA